MNILTTDTMITRKNKDSILVLAPRQDIMVNQNNTCVQFTRESLTDLNSMITATCKEFKAESERGARQTY